MIFVAVNSCLAIWFYSETTELAINFPLLFGLKAESKNETTNILQVHTKSVKKGLTDHIKTCALKL